MGGEIFFSGLSYVEEKSILKNYYYYIDPRSNFVSGDIFCFGLPCVAKVITIPDLTKFAPPPMMAFFFEVVHGKSAPLTPDSKNKKICLRQFFLFLESAVSFAEKIFNEVFWRNHDSKFFPYKTSRDSKARITK